MVVTGNLPLDAAVETNACFGRAEVRPLAAGPLPAGLQPLIARHVANQELIVEASLTRDRDLAFHAILDDSTTRLPADEVWTGFFERPRASREFLPGLKITLEVTVSYFATVPHAAGLNHLPHNPCKLLDFGYLVLADGETYEGASGEREILAVLLGGKGTFTVNGQPFERIGGRPNVFAGKPHSMYIPAGARYTITAAGPLTVALPSAPSDLAVQPYVIPPERVTSGTWGAANFSRNFHQILTLAGQPDLPARRLIVGETYTPSGNWSTYPPHKHEVDDLPREAYQEEMYFFKVTPADGFGMVRYYNDEIDTGYIVKDNTILMAPKGYHTTNSAPGYTSYFLWFLAGNQRVQATVDDPALGWVSRTVPMLKALGH